MNPLQVNSTTGFLDSPSVNVFGSDRKLQFLTVCQDYRAVNRKWPDFGLVCKELGISLTTFERHLKADPKFAEAFRELTLGAKYQLESNLFDLGNKKGFEALIWLRKHFPEEYNPDYKVTVDINPSVTSQLIDKASAFEADIVDE